MKNRTKQLMALFLSTSLCMGSAVSTVGSTAVFAAEEQTRTETQDAASQETSGEGSDTAEDMGKDTGEDDTPEEKEGQEESPGEHDVENPPSESQEEGKEAESDETKADSANASGGSVEQNTDADSGNAAASGETATDTETENTSEEESAEEKTKETNSETEETRAALTVTDMSGTALPMEEISGPQQLTAGGVTRDVDYAQGVHRVYVMEGTENIQITVPDQKDGEQITLTKWNGYLTEKDEKWTLYPDAPTEGGYTNTGNVYTVDLSKYALDQTQITAEQSAVYGVLEGDLQYAEIFVHSESRSDVILVEYVPDYTQVNTLSASATEIKTTYTATGKNLAQSAKKYTPGVSSINGEWQILGLARSDAKVDQAVYDKYLKNVLSTLKENNGVLHKKKYTEYSRVVLALTSLGYDVTDVGGYNLLQPLADYDQTVWQGVNGAIFALIAFDSHDYEIPTAEKGKTQNTREKLIQTILDQEVSGGGWDLSGKNADPDVTAMALQSLAPYYNTDAEVKKAVDRGVAKLSSMQKSDGSFATYGSKTSESCAQVVVALTALGIDPNTDSRFCKNGKSVLEALLAFQQPDGSFRHVMNGGSDQMATEQAYYALTAYERFKGGKTSLYDMSDVVLPADKEKAAAVEALIKALPTNVTAADKDQIELTWTKYNALNKTQKGLISEVSLKKLQNASAALKDLDSSWKEPEKETVKTDPSKNNSKKDDKQDNSSADKNKTSETKVVGGTTKQVNLVSGSSKTTGSTADGGKTSSEKSSKEEKDGTKEDSKKSAKTDKDVKKLKTRINRLFSGSEKLPDDPKDFTEKQTDEILDIYRTYTELSDTQKKELSKTGNYKKYLKVLEQLRNMNHCDTESGTDLSDNEEELLPWYIRLRVDEKKVEQENAQAVRDALNGQGELLTMSEISLEDLLDGETWQPDDLLRVSIPLIDLGEYEQAAVVHLKEDGSMEFLAAHIAGENLEFDTDHFSRFGVVGYNGSMAELMQEQKEENMWIFLVPGAGAALLLILLMMRKKSAAAEKKGKDSER